MPRRVLLLAMSCLQGRPMARAFETLLALGPDGVQLTPGNQPTPDFERVVAAARVPTRTHHGFSYRAFRTREVWTDDGACTVASDSVHPPRADAAAAARFLDAHALPILETMYPGWALADGAALRDAMARRLALAVDVSHLHIQRAHGLIDDATIARVLDYDRIAEVHVSANDGTRDQHRPLDARAFGLPWARERLAAGTPVILECYFHQLSDDERRAQLDLLRERRRHAA
jgi:hypothetical protein